MQVVESVLMLVEESHHGEVGQGWSSSFDVEISGLQGCDSGKIGHYIDGRTAEMEESVGISGLK